MNVCKSLLQDQVMVPSSSGKTEYRVTCILGAAIACTCSGFHYTGKCKHLNQGATYLCAWREDMSPEPQTQPGICPKCGRETVESAA